MIRPSGAPRAHASLVLLRFAERKRIEGEHAISKASPKLQTSNGHLMNSVSRSWSRPTNDFIVRKREKRS